MKTEKDFRLGFHPFIFLVGYKRLSLPVSQLEDFLNLCREHEIDFREISLLEDSARLCIPFFNSRKILRAASSRGIDAKVVLEGGIPALVKKHKARVGLAIGLALSVFLIALGSNVIWDIRIDGAIRSCEQSVKQILEECGLSVGKLRRSLDVDAIENRTLILSDDISWISVNIIGTVAEVEIRELDPLPESEEEYAAENIVAERGGVIVGFEDARGNIAVAIGDAVSEGDLLIGGIYGDEENSFRYTAAKGRVLAECVIDFKTDVERKYLKKSYTGREKCEKYLIFFKKEIKFFSNCGNLYTTYDKIDTVEYLRSPNGELLPIGVRTVKYLEYEYSECEYSDEELFALADIRLDTMIANALGGGELLGVSSSFELSDEKYSLFRRVRCIKDIAKRAPIDILP